MSPSSPELGGPRPSRRATVAALAVALIGLATAGALAHRAWLTAPIPRSVPTAAARPGPPPAFLLAVIDGVREDALADRPDTPMPFVVSLAKGGASGVAFAGDPTMSGPCIRTLLSGRAPDLYTAFKNIRALPAEGNLVAALADRGARIAHAGDVVIPNLVGPRYEKGDALDLAGRSFDDVGDLDDLAFPFALEKASDPSVRVLTYHLVVGDLTGHRWSAVGPEYPAALRVMDDRLRAVVLAFVANNADATVLVAADHGLSSWGSHGSGEPEARRAPFVLTGPRVARVRGLEIPQAALAPTIAALLGLPQPPLAEAPPEPRLTTLSSDEIARAIDEHVLARIEVAKRVGATDVAEAIEAKRAKVWLERATGTPSGSAPSPEVLASLSRALDDRALSPTSGLFGAAALLLALLVVLALARGGAGFEVRAPGRGRGAAALAGCLALPVLAGCGVVLEDVFVAARDLSVPTRRALSLVAVALAVALALARRRRVWPRAKAFAAEHPSLLVAVAGAILGFALTVRLGIDRVVHTPIVVASAALAAFLAAVLSDAARERAPRARWVALGLLGTALVGGRVAEALWSDEWTLRAPGTDAAWLVVPAAAALAMGLDAIRRSRRGDRAGASSSAAFALLPFAYASLTGGSYVEAASFSLLALAARAAAEIPGPTTRAGVAVFAVLLLLVRAAAFHALGRIESLWQIDVGGKLIPGAATAAGLETLSRLSTEGATRGLFLLAREGLVWAALLLAAGGSLRRAGAPLAMRRLATDLALGLAARGVAVLAGMWVWWRWAWWVAAAYPVYAIAVADLLLLLLAFAAVGGLRGENAPRGARPREEVAARIAVPVR